MAWAYHTAPNSECAISLTARDTSISRGIQLRVEAKRFGVLYLDIPHTCTSVHPLTLFSHASAAATVVRPITQQIYYYGSSRGNIVWYRRALSRRRMWRTKKHTDTPRADEAYSHGII